MSTYTSCPSTEFLFTIKCWHHQKKKEREIEKSWNISTTSPTSEKSLTPQIASAWAEWVNLVSELNLLFWCNHSPPSQAAVSRAGLSRGWGVLWESASDPSEGTPASFCPSHLKVYSSSRLQESSQSLTGAPSFLELGHSYAIAPLHVAQGDSSHCS